MTEYTNEILIFSAAFDGGNERLLKAQSENQVRYILRTNQSLVDPKGELLWHESAKHVTSVTNYLADIKSRITTLTPTELNTEYAGQFRSALLSALRLISPQEELAFFGAGNSFNRWLRWEKLFAGSDPEVASPTIRIYCFAKATPVSEIKIDLPMIKTFQQLLDHAYTAFLINHYRPGRFGTDWGLYNLKKCKALTGQIRHAKISPEQIELGDDLAILRLHTG